MLDYNDILYDEIKKDEELISFFQTIQQYSENIYDSTRRELEDQLDSIKMDYSKLLTLIDKLKQKGIVITNNEEWFALENRYIRGMPSREEIEKFFFSAKYNGIHILDADFVYVQETVTRNKKQNTERFICRSQIEYEDWLRQYKSVEVMEKKFKKLCKKEKRQAKYWYSSWVDTLGVIETERILLKGLNLKSKLEFLHNLSEEQLEIMKDIFGAFLDMCDDYFDKRLDVESQLEKNKGMRLINPNVFFNRALLKFLEENRDDINIKSVERKLAKALLINKLLCDESDVIDLIIASHNKTEYEKVVDWFISLKNEEIANVGELFIKKFDLILSEEKVLKK